MCFFNGGQSVADFIKNLIGMLQNTNSSILRPNDYGLTPHTERDENGLDANGQPPVFLKPESLLADAFGDEEELNLDLRRLRPLKKEDIQQQQAAAAAQVNTDSTPPHLLKPFKIPPLPTPPSHSALRYTSLSKLKRLRPPADAPPEVLVVSTLIPPCSLPEHLAKCLPEGMRTLSLTSSLQARASSAIANAIAASSSDASAASVPSQATTKKAMKAAEQLQRKIDEYANHVYDMLLARGVGEDPHLKLQMEAARANAKSSVKGERIGTSSAELAADGKQTMWGGYEDQIPIKLHDNNKLEVPLIFVSTKKVPEPLPKRFDVTQDCFVITTQRCVQIEAGAIVEELPLGSDSGNILKLPKETDDGTPGRCPIHLIVKNAIEIELEEAAAAAAENEDGEEEEHESAPASSSATPINRRQRARAKSISRQTQVSFYVPNPDIAGFIEEYLMYFQEKSSLESQLGLIEQARLDRIEHYKTERCLRGWTFLLKSLVGPIIFGPLRQPVYENTIKQLFAKLQQMDLKQVKITSLKLVDFKIPELDAEALQTTQDGDQIPALRLRDWIGHPHHMYTFDIFWSAPTFCIKFQISGKKIVSFKLELEMKGIEVRGSLRLRSSPYEPEKAAVSFVAVPQLSFGVGSHVVIGSVKLPFQRAIEKIIYAQIQAAIESGLRENIVGDKWQSIHFEKSGLSLQLDRWWGINQYPFKYDGTDDEDMMSLALVVTTQAEKSLSETVKEMRSNRDKMQAWLGHSRGVNPTGAAAAAAASASSSNGQHSKRSSIGAKDRDNGDSSHRSMKQSTPPKSRRQPSEDDDEPNSAPSPAPKPKKSPAPPATSARRKSRAQIDEDQEEED